MGEAKIKEDSAAAKEKDFLANPDHYVHIGDCLVVVDVIRDDEGKILKYRMNSNILKEDEGHIARGRANMIIDTALFGLVRQKQQSAIIKPGMPGNGNRIMPGVR